MPGDVAAMAGHFEGFGYQAVLPGLGDHDGAEQIRQKLRHYLLCWDSQDDDPATTALATEDLVRILCRGELRHLLIVLDTCRGGAGSADVAGLALQSIAYRHGGGATSTGLWFLASARRKADRFGLVRVWDLRSASWTAEIDIGSSIRDVAVGGGQLCVATHMGAVVLGLTTPTGEENATP